MNSRIVFGSILLDGVPLFGFNGDFAFCFLLGYGAAWCAAAPIPRDCMRGYVSKEDKLGFLLSSDLRDVGLRTFVSYFR
jgi:hypothetical protein